MPASEIARGKWPVFLAFALASYALQWVAIFNGYPMVYYDSYGYLFSSITLSPESIHPIVYGLFIRLASLGTTPWLAIVAQAAITVFVLFAVFDYVLQARAEAQRNYPLYLGMALLLALTTSLPWFVGQLMPDVFSGLALLCLFLLCYSSKLSSLQAVLISGLLALTVGAHTTNLLSACAVFVVVLILRAFKATRSFWPRRSAKELAVYVVLPMVASAAFVASTNWAAGMGFAISPGGPVVLLGRLFDSGLAQEYLQQRCAVEPLTPCKYLGNLPRSNHEFLWGGHPLFQEMGAWTGSHREAMRIIRGTIAYKPLAFLADCGKQMVLQSFPFDPEESTHQGASRFVAGAVAALMPGDLPKFERTQQMRGRLAKFEHRFAPFQTAVYWCALLVSLVMASIRRYRQQSAAQLLFVTLIFLMANALVTGALSQIAGRYQSRVSWLMLLCCIAFVTPAITSRAEAAPDMRCDSAFDDSSGQ